jgi:hypothetical protein
VNDHLKVRDVRVDDIEVDFQNGVPVCHLAEVLTFREINRGKWVRNPKTKVFLARCLIYLNLFVISIGSLFVDCFQSSLKRRSPH